MKKALALITIFTALITQVISCTPVGAVNVFPNCDSSNSDSSVCGATSDKLFGVGSIWNRILETFTYIIGAVAVLMIIVGGIRYITSNGDQSQVTAAKNTILYAVVGLVVAVLAYAIVHFVISNI